MAHQAKVVEIKEVADGILSVRARCCADKTTDSVLSLHGLDRGDSSIDADVQNHLTRVEQQHANRDRAKAQLQRLLAK